MPQQTAPAQHQKYLELTVVGPCPTCQGRPAKIEGCLTCDGWGTIPELRTVGTLAELHDLFMEIQRHNLKAAE